MKSRDERLDEMLAKDEIRDVLMRYGRGVDRADAALLASCYHDGAIEEHGSTYSGPAATYIQGAIPRIRNMSALAHYICNISISLEGSRAYVESYVLTFARFRKDAGSFDTLTGGRICDRFECRNGEWRIAHRKMAFDWNFDTPSNEGWCVGLFNPTDPRMVMGQKGPEDLSYQRF